jgi:hypothetical protein
MCDDPGRGVTRAVPRDARVVDKLLPGFSIQGIPLLIPRALMVKAERRIETSEA